MTPSTYAILIGPFEAYSFMRIALAACLALALANGPLGSLLLLRRMSLDGDVLAHAIMPGAAIGFLYAGRSLFALGTGGFLSGVVVAILAGQLFHTRRRRDDASLVAFYVIALALCVMLVAWRGSNVDVMRVLFGTVLAVDVPALLMIAAVASVTLLLLAAFYRALAVDAFDPLFLRVTGAGGMVRGLFVVLVVLNLVVSVEAFGTLLAIGPLLLPAAAARCWTRRAAPMMALATVIGVAANLAGLLISYHANLPSGPAIVLSAGVLYGISLPVAALTRRIGVVTQGAAP